MLVNSNSNYTRTDGQAPRWQLTGADSHLSRFSMNKAFVREPEDDGRAYCPRCGTLGRAVERGPLDTYIKPEFRGRLTDSAWFCGFPRCEVAYFDLFGAIVVMDELNAPVYPYDPDAPICA